MDYIQEKQVKNVDIILKNNLTKSHKNYRLEYLIRRFLAKLCTIRENIGHYIVSLVGQVLFNNGGTTFGAITKDDLFGLRILIPTKNIIEKFEEKIKCIDQRIFQDNTEKQELVSLRDYLLPLLMNGQIGFRD